MSSDLKEILQCNQSTEPNTKTNKVPVKGFYTMENRINEAGE